MIAIIMRFNAGELTLEEFDTIGINRQRNQFDVNVTNDRADFALNAVFDNITALLGDDETFTMIIKQDNGQAEFNHITVTYHLTSQAEILNFSQVFTQKQEDKEQ